MISISPGIAQGCFTLLDLLGRHRLSFAQIAASFPFIASVASETVVDTARGLGWLHLNDEGYVSTTGAGALVQSLAGYEAMLRQALLDYVEAERPPWVQNARFGRARVISFVRTEIAQVFVEAGLLDGTSDDVVLFWDRLGALARGLRSEHLNQIGRTGERLSLAHEERRTGRKPKWIAIENNCDGYDMLSIVEMTDPRTLSIEVKASTVGVAGNLYLSRNEWDTAVDADAHLFHLWDLGVPCEPRIAVVSVDQMASHIPTDNGDGRWDGVQLPFAAFQEAFQLALSGS